MSDAPANLTQGQVEQIVHQAIQNASQTAAATAAQTAREETATRVATEAAAHTVMVMHAENEEPRAVLPKHLRSQVKPQTYDNVEKSGKFKTWERSIRQYIRLQGLDPENYPATHDLMARQIVELSCVGDALQYIQRLDPTKHSFNSLLAELSKRFTRPEEARNARRALDRITMKNKTAREYCNQFERLLDDAPPLPDEDQLYLFYKGLPRDLQQWMNFQEPKNLTEATTLICRMSGENNENHSRDEKSGEPMEIDRLSRTLNKATAALNRLNVSDNCPRPDPNSTHSIAKDPAWPRWAKAPFSMIQARKARGLCYICGDRHNWRSCPKKEPSRARSPSPTWTARSPSPSKKGVSPR